MVEIEISEIIKRLSGLDAYVVDNTIYLNNIIDVNDFFKLINALNNLINNNINPIVSLDIKNYLDNSDICKTTYQDDVIIINVINDLNIIYAISGYLSIKDTKEIFYIKYNEIDVRKIIKKFIDKNNFPILSEQIKIIT